jgi:hypothetical protein
MNELARLTTALRRISELGGNLPDDRLTSKTGPNDAVHRDLIYCEARRIALDALPELDQAERTQVPLASLEMRP